MFSTTRLYGTSIRCPKDNSIAQAFSYEGHFTPGVVSEDLLCYLPTAFEVSASNTAPWASTKLRPSSFPSRVEALVTDACTYRPTLSVMLPVPVSSSLKTLIALSLDHHNGSDARCTVSHLYPLRGLSNLNDFADSPVSCSLDSQRLIKPWLSRIIRPSSPKCSGFRIFSHNRL